MSESLELDAMRRDDCLRALYKAAFGKPNTLARDSWLTGQLDLPLPLLGFVICRLQDEGLVNVQTRVEGSMIELTSPGLAAAHAFLEDRSRLKTRILCIDTEPEVIDRLKTSGYSVHDVSMGYRTGKRSFAFPPPNEVDLIVCYLRRPGCFDVSDWKPLGANNNFDCRLLPYEKTDSTFTVRGGLRSARFQVIRESQLGDSIPGTFGPSDVNRAIREVGTPFLLFLNSGWLDRISSFPNWTNLTWSFRPTAASQIELVEPLPSVLPELNRER